MKDINYEYKTINRLNNYKIGLILDSNKNWILYRVIKKVAHKNSYFVNLFEQKEDLTYILNEQIIKIENILIFLNINLLNKIDIDKDEYKISKELKDFLDKNKIEFLEEYKKNPNGRNILKINLKFNNNPLKTIFADNISKKNNSKSSKKTKKNQAGDYIINNNEDYKLKIKEFLEKEKKSSQEANLIMKNSLFNKINNIQSITNSKFKLSGKEKGFSINKKTLIRKNYYNLTLYDPVLKKKSIYGEDLEYNEIEFNSIYKKLFRIIFNGTINDLKKFLKNNKLATLTPKLSSSNKLTTFDICLMSNNNELFFNYLNLMKEHNYSNYNINLNNKIKIPNTGYNNKYAYGVKTRRVKLSRNNKMGNEAFVKDILYSRNNYFNSQDIEKIAKNLKCVDRFKYLCVTFNNIENECINHFNYFIEYKNNILASYIAELGFLRNDFGFNKFYKDAISGNLDDLKDIRPVSIKKKLYNVSEFLLINASFINPNEDIPLFLLEKLDDISLKDKFNRSLLFYAAISPHLKIFDFLIKKGLYINDYDLNRITPFMMACKVDNYKIVEYIINLNNCDIKFKDKNGYAAIHYCARYGSLESFKILIKNKNNLKLKGPKNKSLASIISKYGNLELLKYLLNNCDINLSMKDKYGMTPIMYSIMNYNNDCLTTLLAHGSDPKLNDSSENSLFHYAAGYSNIECIDILLNLKLDPNSKNIWNLTPLNIAYLKGNYSFISEWIKLDNIDINSVDENGRTILSNLISCLNIESLNFFKILINQNSINIQKKDINLNSPLHFLSLLNINELKNKELENFNFNLNTYDDFKNSLIHKKIYKEYFDVVFDNKIINEKNKNKETPIDIALKNRNQYFFELLYEKDSKIDFINCNIFLLKNLIYFKNCKNILDFILKKFKNLKDLINITNNECLTPLFDWIKNFLNNKDQYLNNFLNNKNFKYDNIMKFNHHITFDKSKYIKWKNRLFLKNFKIFIDLLIQYDSKIQQICIEKEIDNKKTLQNNNQYNNNYNNYNQYNRYNQYNQYKNNFNSYNNNFRYKKNKKNKKNITYRLNNNNFNNYSDDDYDDDEYSNNDFDEEDNLEKKYLKEYKKYSKSNIFHILFENYNKEIYDFLFNEYNLINSINYINLGNSLNITPFDIFINNFESIRDFNIIDIYINKNFDFNKINLKGEYLLNNLIKQNCFYEIISYIKNNHENYYKSIDFNIYDKNFYNPVLYFSKNNNLKNLKLIINEIDINSKDYEKKTPLIWAIINSDLEDFSFIELLLTKKDIDINIIDIFERNIFHYIFITSILLKKMCFRLLFLFENYTNNEIFMNMDIYNNTCYHYYSMSINNLLHEDIFSKGESLMLKNNLYGLNILTFYLLLKDSSFSLTLIKYWNVLNTKIYIIDYEKKQEEDLKLFKLEKLEIYNRPVFNNIYEKIESNNNYNNNNYNNYNNYNHYNNYNYNRFNKGTRFGMKRRVTMNENINNDNKSIDEKYTNLYDYLKYLKKSDENLKYIKKEYNIFQLSLKLKNFELLYKLLIQGYSDDLAIIDCLKLNDINYANYLLSEKKLSSYNNNIKTELGENVLICYVRYVEENDEKSVIFKKIVDNYLNIFERDNNLRNALHYSFKKLNISFINKMLEIFEKDKNFKEKDNFNNNYLSFLINIILKKLKNNKNFFNNYISNNNNNNTFYNNNYGNTYNNNSFNRRLNYNQNRFGVYYKESLFLNLIKSLIIQYNQKLDFNYSLKNGSITNSLIEFYKINKIYDGINLEIFNEILNISDINLKNSKDENIISLAIKKKNDLELISKLIKDKNFNGKILINDLNYLNLCINYNSFTSYNNYKLFEILYPFCKDNLNENNLNKIIEYCVSCKNSNWLDLIYNLNKNIKIKYEKEIKYDIDYIDYPNQLNNYNEDYEDFIKEQERKNNIKLENKTNVLDRRCGNFGEIQKYDNLELNFYMVKIDLNSGYNSKYLFYKMQYYFDKINETYNIFTNWGRIHDQGQHQITPFKTYDEGLKEFKKIFWSKTSNELGKEFKPIEKKYKLLNIKKEKKIKNYNINIFDEKEENFPEFKIKKEIIDILKDFATFKLYHNKFSRLHLDKSRINLLNLDKNELLKAVDLLNYIKENILKLNKLKSQNNFDPKNLELYYKEINKNYELSSRFFEYFPINTSFLIITPINTLEEFNRINSNLLNVLQIEECIKIIIGSQNRKKEINPFDYIYNNLNCKINYLEKNNEEYLLLYKFIKKSFSQNINKNKIDIFSFKSKIDENKKIFKNDFNKRLLFHGTKNEHMISIIKKGLVIDAPDSIKTGNMFGKGIYFADIFDKAYNYSGTSYHHSNSTNDFILICEVTWGKLFKTFYNTNNDLKDFDLNIYDSLKCKGKKKRKKEERLYTFDDIMIPFGDIKERIQINNQIHLEKNEFVIFDQNRIKINYIVKVKK